MYRIALCVAGAFLVLAGFLANETIVRVVWAGRTEVHWTEKVAFLGLDLSLRLLGVCFLIYALITKGNLSSDLHFVMKRYPRTFAAGVGAVSLVIILGVIETGCYFGNESEKAKTTAARRMGSRVITAWGHHRPCYTWERNNQLVLRGPFTVAEKLSPDMQADPRGW